MAKIKITTEQYNKILLHEQNNRLNSSKKLNEGVKEVVLAVSKLMGLKLSGLNKEMADKALKDKAVMREILSTFEDVNKIKNLISSLEEKGMENAKDKLSTNAKDIVNNYNKASEENKIGIKMGLFIMSNLKGEN
jgi:hypothetical protein